MKLYNNMTVSLILPEIPTKVEAFAGEEVKKYLTKIFGAVTFAEGAELQFIIGNPARNAAAAQIVTAEKFAEKVPGPEGLFYAIKGNTAMFAGSDDNGTLYAVYEFLEKEMGCCFGAFSLEQVPAGEIVPTCTEKELADTCNYQAAADLPYRMAVVQCDGSGGRADRGLMIPYFDYLAKNRYNRIQTWVGVYIEMNKLGYMEELAKRGIRITVGMHEVLNFFLPFEGNAEFPIAYGKEHPEFYRVLVDGRRQVAEGRRHWGQWYLCSRSEACMDEMAKNINAWLDRNPVVDTIHLCPNDGVSRQCQCGYCSKHTKMENYMYFADQVSQRLKEANPERSVNIIVYLDLWDCPKGMKLDGAVPQISTWTKRGLRAVGKPDGSCLTESHIAKTLQDFLQTGSTVQLYEYYMGNYDNKQAVMPAADEMQSIAKYYKANGIDGSGSQMECFNLWNNIFNFFTFARTAYTNEMTLEDSIAKMCRMFGAGGEAIAEILRIYENTMDGQVPINQTGKWFALTVDKDTIFDLFEKALEQAETPLYRNNVRMMRMAFRYTILLQTDTDEAKEELGVMASHFDSYHVCDPGFGIAIDVEYRTEQIPTDKWYQFEK